jgi:hypothetical protein
MCDLFYRLHMKRTFCDTLPTIFFQQIISYIELNFVFMSCFPNQIEHTLMVEL